ncbi:MAG: PA14 domain-containing protein [Chloroflexota bacterium]|nr:PA14 domain-containing protein [Chloroflexota bacterium]
MWRKIVVFALLLTLGAALIAPTAAQSGIVWRGEYFNNGNFTGSPSFVRNDNQIAFNWGNGSPDPTIPSDNFSVRWATDVALGAGTYRFYAQADDNIKITFNFGFQPVIDTFAQSDRVNQLVTGDVTVPANGTYHIQIDYRELTSVGFAYVTFANLATNPNFPGFAITAPPTQSSTLPVGGGAWTAQYYGNNSLQGDPAAIFTEAQVSHNWGATAPLVNIAPDNFSVRWSSVQNLSGGAYSLNVRADDGVRVYVNGVLTIDEWHAASGLTYSRALNLPSGANTFVVEYYEGTGDAFIDFNLTGAGSPVFPTQQPNVQPGGVTATVTAFRLNVRNAPNSTTGGVITRISRFEQYPIIARTANNLWVQLNINGTLGWVNVRFVNIAPLGANIPVVGGGAVSTSVAPGGNVVTATPFNVVIRQGASTANNRVGLLPVGGTAQVIGRSAANTWWQINYNGLVGWVSAQFAIISPTANIGTIPITG